MCTILVTAAHCLPNVCCAPFLKMIWDVQEKADIAEEKATDNAQTVVENATKAAEITC